MSHGRELTRKALTWRSDFSWIVDRCVGASRGALAAELWVRECRTGFQQFPFVSDNLTYQISDPAQAVEVAEAEEDGSREPTQAGSDATSCVRNSLHGLVRIQRDRTTGNYRKPARDVCIVRVAFCILPRDLEAWLLLCGRSCPSKFPQQTYPEEVPFAVVVDR